jgi:hypothetical protein
MSACVPEFASANPNEIEHNAENARPIRGAALPVSHWLTPCSALEHAAAERVVDRVSGDVGGVFVSARRRCFVDSAGYVEHWNWYQ